MSQVNASLATNSSSEFVEEIGKIADEGAEEVIR